FTCRLGSHCLAIGWHRTRCTRTNGQWSFRIGWCQLKSIAFKPVITIVGGANVGKSTVFNRLTRSRRALVADFPGLTRDRHYGEGRLGSRPYLVVDTGGFEPVVKDGIVREMARQTEQAIAESDVIIFLVDAREGVNRLDYDIAQLLRRSGQ